MSKIISIHEYKLKSGISNRQFELTVKSARKQGLFDLPGLIQYHFLKRIRGTRNVDYAAIWIYKNQSLWQKLWGKPDKPVDKDCYPEKWKIWEEQLLAPLLAQDPDRIFYAAYKEF